MTTIRSISLAHPLRARGASHTYLSTEKAWSFALVEPWIVVRHADSPDLEWLVPVSVAMVERERAPSPRAQRSKRSELDRQTAPVGVGVAGSPAPDDSPDPCYPMRAPGASIGRGTQGKPGNAVRNTRASVEPSDTNEMRALHAQVFGDGSERD